MRNIIITGGELFNKGAQAMTFVAVDEIRKRFPDHRIYLLSEMDLARPEQERQQYAFDFMGWNPIKFARCQHDLLLRLLCMLRNGRELAEAGYKTRYFQDIIWVCNYLDDGLTKHADSIYVNNPRGYGLTIQERMKFTNQTFPKRFKAYYAFYAELQHKHNYRDIASFLYVPSALMALIKIIYQAKRFLSR